MHARHLIPFLATATGLYLSYHFYYRPGLIGHWHSESNQGGVPQTLDILADGTIAINDLEGDASSGWGGMLEWPKREMRLVLCQRSKL